MPFSNDIYAYFSGIQSGKFTVGKWVRLLYEFIIAGLEKGGSISTRKRQTRRSGLLKIFVTTAKEAGAC